MQQFQWIVTPHRPEFLRQLQQRRRSPGKLAGQQHLPVVPLSHQRVQFPPRIPPQRARNHSQRLMLDHRLRHDHQLRVPSRNIEMVNVIPKMIAISKHPAARAHRQRE